MYMYVYANRFDSKTTRPPTMSRYHFFYYYSCHSHFSTPNNVGEGKLSAYIGERNPPRYSKVDAILASSLIKLK